LIQFKPNATIINEVALQIGWVIKNKQPDPVKMGLNRLLQVHTIRKTN